MKYSKSGVLAKQHDLKSTSNKLTTKFCIFLFRALLITIVFGLFLGISAAIGVLKGLLDNAPNLDQINVAPTGFSTTIYDQDGNELAKLVGSSANRIYVTIDEIPQVLKDAFVSIEDERFWQHSGIDIRGMFRAFFVGVTNSSFTEGASTITQQLLKNNVFDGGREDNFIERAERKIQEQYLAIQLEKTLGKEQILEYYLNTINLGQNTLGVQVAYDKYFDKPLSKITVSEAAVIAAITQNPTIYDPVTHPDKNQERRAKILGNMLEQNYITDKEYEKAIKDTEKVYARIQTTIKETSSNSINSYFIDELTTQVIKDLKEIKGYTPTQASNALYRGGLSIYTTQDSKIQQICDEAFSNPENFPTNSKFELTYRLSIADLDGEEIHYSEKDVLQHNLKTSSSFNLLFSTIEEAQLCADEFKATVLQDGYSITGESFNAVIQPQVSFTVIENSTGQVKAIIGGRGTKTANRTLNRATSTVRQPGSTFKTLSTYLPALDTAGMTLATVINDSPYTYPDGKVLRNWNSKYKGLTTLREAIAQSMNIVTVKTLEAITPILGYDYLINLNFTTLVNNVVRNDKTYSDVNLSLALGGITDGVTNLELTAAYASIANKGVYIEPTFYTKILDHDNQVLIDKTPSSHSVMKETTSWLLTNAMQDVVKIGTGTLTNFRNIKMPVAGKTGTTTDNYDIWFSGFTPYYTASIWSGYDNNTVQQTDTSFHKTLWRNVMEEINKELPVVEFEKPSSIVTAKICTKSGKLAIDGVCTHAPGGSTARNEYFTLNTLPTEKCDVHVKLTICKESKKLAGEFCPNDQRSEAIYMVTPKDINAGNSSLVTSDSPYELPAGFEETTCHIHNAPIIIIEPEITIETYTTEKTTKEKPENTTSVTIETETEEDIE